ncbi:MAG TPA: hypothetical protein VGZ91_13485 [Candidatus Sulfotelmatobacter sp.]|jgi:hypothetical protein|nr:hypothetical protein [Candidatus Sulfotelmatobacter sp.]
MSWQMARLGLVYACLCAGSVVLPAQEFKLLDRTVQMHGFASQGFVYTNDNNWLTMNTSQGSAAFTDFGINASSQLTDKFRVGAQGYDRSLGRLGQYHPSLDWAFADYRFKNWFGVRGGKVKTTLGLYNDTQDLDFLHTFALLPQSVYPTDLRDATIAHLGGDVYGNIPLKHRFGDLSYTAYAGHRSDSLYSGYPYLLSQYGVQFKSLGGLQYGADLRWNTPVKGLFIGASRLDQDTTGKGADVNPLSPTGGIIPYFEYSRADWTNQFYGQYARGKLRIASEYRRYLRDQIIYDNTSENLTDVRGWYLSGAYRVIKRLELGSYYSRYTIVNFYKGALAAIAPNETDTSLPADHIYDKVITARVDLTGFWNVKLEGHFMNGYAASTYPDGFYPQVNPQGFKPNTNALVLKTSVNF